MFFVIYKPFFGKELLIEFNIKFFAEQYIIELNNNNLIEYAYLQK